MIPHPQVVASPELGEAHEVRLSQGTIRYHERGSGPTLVFVHGAVVDSTIWRKVIDALAGEFRCIAPDLPLGSHRIPMEPDADLTPRGQAAILADFLEALGLTDVTLVGNDTGGAVCQLLITSRPERVGRLVLTNCDAFELFPPQPFALLFGLAGRLPGGVTAFGVPMRSRRLRTAVYGLLTRRPVPDAIVAGWVEPIAHDPAIRRDFRKLLQGVDPGETLDAAAQLRSFQGPSLLVWGADDPFFTAAHGRRIAAALRDARFEPVADCRTFVAEDQPGVLAEAIRRFAGEREAERAA